MLLEIFLFMLLGIFFGILTGLIPGIHINLIGTAIIGFSASLFLHLQPIYLIVFISAMAISNTFINFIPSILLGCPDTDTELSVLPGHEFLRNKRGYEAIILTAYGGLASLLLLIIIIIPSFLVVPFLQEILLKKLFFPKISIMSSILILVSFYLISSEKNKISALGVFLITGILGLVVLGSIEKNFLFFPGLEIEGPLLPLLTGLFGASMLITSIKTKTQIPEQKIKNPKIKKGFLNPLFGALIASPLSGFLPGLGSGQAAIIGNVFSKENKENFMILLGATNTFVMSFSFIAFYLISRTRTGAVAAIENLIGNFSLELLVLILIIIILTGIFSFFLTFPLAKFFSKKISKINYSKLSLIVLISLAIIVLLISNFLGFVVFIISTITGLYCISLKVRRTNMMGCLLIPTIIFYLLL